MSDVFVAFQARYAQPIKDLGNIERQRGLYGVDILIEADGTPRLLEVTFAPDMGRFGQFQPEGWNEVFGHLFFNDEKGVTRIV